MPSYGKVRIALDRLGQTFFVGLRKDKLLVMGHRIEISWALDVGR